MNLAEAQLHKWYKIEKVKYDMEFMLRIMTLGLVEDASVKVVSRVPGTLEVQVMDSKVAVSENIAKNIMVV